MLITLMWDLCNEISSNSTSLIEMAQKSYALIMNTWSFKLLMHLSLTFLIFV